MYLSEQIQDNMLSNYLSEFDGVKIKLPIKKEYYPDKLLLMKHMDTVFKR